MHSDRNKINYSDVFSISKEFTSKIIKTWLIILLSIFLICSFALSQSAHVLPKYIVLDGENCMAFSIEQSKKMAIINESYKECEAIYTITESSLNSCYIQISNYKKLVVNDSLIISNKDREVALVQIQKEALTNENQNLSRELKKMSRKYRFTTISFLVTTVVAFTLYVSTFL